MSNFFLDRLFKGFPNNIEINPFGHKNVIMLKDSVALKDFNHMSTFVSAYMTKKRKDARTVPRSGKTKLKFTHNNASLCLNGAHAATMPHVSI